MKPLISNNSWLGATACSTLICLAALPTQADFLTPTWRGQANTEHAAWLNFTQAFNSPNLPDIAVDLPTANATLTCSTSTAFITGSSNIYSFQSPLSIQIDDSANYPVQSVVLQVATMGAPLDSDSLRMIALDAEGEPYLAFPIRSQKLNSTDLGSGETFGGADETWIFQWDFSAAPFEGTWSILFSSASSSMSLVAAAIDTANFFEPWDGANPPSLPQPQILRHNPQEITLSWPANNAVQIQSADSPGPNATWSPIEISPSLVDGQHQITLSIDSSQKFFRLATQE